MSDSPPDLKLYFQIFNEIGILEQLSRAMFEARLPDGVLVSHFAVLNHLVRVRDGQTPLDIAHAFQVPKTTLSHTLSLLDKRGWIAMRPNPDDKRSKRIWLTETGRQFRDKAIADLLPDLAEVAEGLHAGVAEDLLTKLQAMRRHLDQMRDRAMQSRPAD